MDPWGLRRPTSSAVSPPAIPSLLQSRTGLSYDSKLYRECRLRLTALEMLGRRPEPQSYQWTDRDYLLYALAIGLGSHPQHGPALSFVYEEHLRVVPTFPTVV